MPFWQVSELPHGVAALQGALVGGVGTHWGAPPACAAQYESPWHSSPGSAQKSPASFGVAADTQTDWFWPTTGAHTRLPEQSLSPVHDWFSAWLPTTTLPQMASTLRSVDAEMDVWPPPYALFNASMHAFPLLCLYSRVPDWAALTKFMHCVV
jgi:hypothetical protein